VPTAWIDHVLPLSLSQPADVKRVMFARIELVTDDQQKLLDKLATTAPSDPRWLDKIPTDIADRFFAGRMTEITDLGVEIPADYRTYLELGRFRNALVTAEERRRPSQNLSRFINTYGLEPFRLPARPSTPTARDGSPRQSPGGQ
jgi:hypothetical protein